MNNFLLEVVIPTYNRPKCIESILNYFVDNYNKKVYDFCISIYDSSINNETEKVVSSYGLNYVKYYRISDKIDVDKKTVMALKNSTSDYIWLCGDGIIPKVDEIFERFDLKKCGYELIVLYSKYLTTINRYYLKLNECEDRNKGDFFENNFAQITLYGGTICARTIIEKADIKELEQYYLTGFIYPCMLAIYSSGPYYRSLGEYLISLENKGSPGWINSGNAIRTWTYNFYNDVMSLSVYLGGKATNKIICSNGKLTGFLTFKGFVWFRATGNFNWKIYKEYKFYIHKCKACSIMAIYLVLLMPEKLTICMRKLYKYIKCKRKGRA